LLHIDRMGTRLGGESPHIFNKETMHDSYTPAAENNSFERRNLAMQVADAIAQRLISPGAPSRRVPSVRAIARQYRISPNTANAALRLLAERHLVRVIPRQGTFLIPGGAEAALCC
jgi:DNA-binding GntR family transcriptional regulator